MKKQEWRRDAKMLAVRLPADLWVIFDALISERRRQRVAPYSRTRIVDEALRAYITNARQGRHNTGMPRPVQGAERTQLNCSVHPRIMDALTRFVDKQKHLDTFPRTIREAIVDALEQYLKPELDDVEPQPKPVSREYYCYEIWDGDKVIYVGKGKGQRCAQHLGRKEFQQFDELSIKVYRHNSEADALQDEAQRIERYGVENLVNKVQPKPQPGLSDYHAGVLEGMIRRRLQQGPASLADLYKATSHAYKSSELQEVLLRVRNLDVRCERTGGRPVTMYRLKNA